MSFTAENNVIRVTDTNGDVVFDTGTPMPHIAAVIYSNVTHTFPESEDTTVAVGGGPVPAIVSGCRNFENVCNFDYVCTTTTQCGFKQQCSLQYVCEYDFFSGSNVCGFKNVCENRYVCEQVETCGFQNVCEFEWVDVEGYETVGANRVSALEHSEVYDLGSVPEGTNPDFLLVLMTASRTVAGSQADFGSFISAIPTGQKIAANGSTVLESAFIPGSAPWLSRIVSVYLSGNTVRAEFKHSNREYTSQLALNVSQSCLFYPAAYAQADNTSSTWSINFEVYVGKFTQ